MIIFLFTLLIVLTISCNNSSINEKGLLCDILNKQINLLSKKDRLELKKNKVYYRAIPIEEKIQFKGYLLPEIVISDKLIKSCKNRFLISVYLSHTMSEGPENNLNIKLPSPYILNDTYVKKQGKDIIKVAYYLFSPKEYYMDTFRGPYNLFRDKKLFPYINELKLKLKKQGFRMNYP